MKVAVLLVLCAAGTFAIPTRDRRLEQDQQNLQTCATRCSGAQTKFWYAPGKAYEYDLKSQTKVQLGDDQVQTTVSQSATVTISVQSPCELSMKLSNVQMTGADVPTTWASELEKFPLRFSFDDGLISNVCPQAEEETWALNIKRAILSTFQNALEGRDNEGFEVDVSGRCPTEYENSASGESVSIKRSKNLAACRDSHHQHGAVRSMPYDVRSQLQNTPLLESEQSCEHTINKGLLQQATCTEKHTFQPFTKQPRANNAIFADIEQTLKFNSEKSVDSSAFPSFNEQQSLTFDHSEFGVEQTANPQQSAKESIERLCQWSKDEVRPETPGLFAELVYDIRRLSQEQLKEVYEAAKKSSCEQSIRFFTDALPMCGTEQCVGLMVELITSNAIDQTAELEWYTSLAFVSRPNVKILKAILPLMDRAPAAGLLGISSMAHSYCRYNRGCGNSIDLKNLVKKIHMRLGQSCEAKTETEIQEIVYALKALGNIGNDDSVVPTVVHCFNSKTNQIEVRLAAVRACRRQSCDVELKQPLFNIFKTTNELAELRIAAFVELMRCPTPELIDEIKEQLEKETVNQVGSYVYSYLMEKRRSSDPAQRDLANMLLRHHFDQKFNRDPRRFSRYTELGFLNDKSNVGAHAQTSVIFSPESFLPRQASLNLTAHLFGRSVNFLEIGARSEGLEELMDSLTGPDGYFTNPNGHLFHEKSTAHKNSKVRNLHDLYKKRGSVRDNDHLAASTYIKIFGDEIAYYGFTDYNVVDQIKDVLDVDKLKHWLAVERDIKFNRNVVFLETTMTIPTVSGLPLRLAVNGTAAINFQLKGKADLTKIMQAPYSFDIHATVKPSAAVEIAAMLGVQTGGVRQGVKMIARMHTSTNFGGQMQFREGRLYNAKLSLPDDQMEIFDIQSEIFQVVNNRYQEHPAHRASDVKKICTPQMLGDITGLKVCGQAQIGSKVLPYPFRATVTLEKADPNLQSYDFMIETQPEGEGRMLKIGFDTPGSTIDRKMEAAFGYQPQRGELNLNLRTPFKEIDIEGQLKAATEQSDYEAKIKLTADKKDTYEMEGTLRLENPGHMVKYALTAAAKSNDAAPAKLESAFEYDPNTHRSAKLSLNVDNVFTKPVNFKTELVLLEASQSESNFPKYVCKVDYNGPDMEAKVDSHLEQRGGLDYDVKFEVEYTKAGGKKHNFLAQGAQTWKRTNSDFKLTEMGKFETSVFPNAKLEYELKTEKAGQKWDSELLVTRGNHKSRLVVNTEERENNLLYATVEAKCDTLRLNHKAIVQYQNKLPDQFLAKAELETPSIKDIVAEISVDSTMNPKWNVEATAVLKYPGRELKLKKSIQEKSEGNYKMNTMLQWAQGKSVEVDSDVVYKSTDAETEYTIEGVAKISGQKDPIHIKKHYKSDERQSTYHWVAKRGTNVVYDVRYNWEGQYGEKQTLSAHAKSVVIAQFDYELNGEVTPTDKQTELVATVKNNGKDFGRIEAIVPKWNNHDNKQIKGQVSWDLDTTEPKELMGEWKKVTDGKKRTHDFTFSGKGNGEHYSMNAKVEKSDYYKMNATINKADKPLLSLNFGMKDPRHDVSHIAVDMGFKSFEPFEKHDATAIFLANFRRDNFALRAEVDCKEMATRWLVNTEGSVKPEDSEKLYKLVVDLEAPNGHEIHVIQQAKGKSVIAATKATSNIEIMWAGRAKKIMHVVDMERTARGIKGSSTTKTPFQSLSIVKETYEYSVDTGVLEFKHEIEWNANKKIAVEVKGKNKDTAIGFDAKLTTSFETAKKVVFETECQKLEGYWNCKSASNVNDKYKLSAYQEQANNRQKLGFEADLPDITKSDGHYLYNANAPKYVVELQFKKDDNLYKFAADLNSQKESGMIKIQTPLSELQTVKVIVTKTADNEYELKTERNGDTEGTILGQLRLDDQNQRIRLQFHDITTPFEIVVQNVKDATKQSAKIEVTMDPKGEKRTYGAEAEYTSDEERLTNAKFVLTHPRRQMMVEMLRPADDKIIIQIQPNVGTNRAPTKLELVHKKHDQGYKCEAKLNDPALKQPIHAKFEKKQHGACGEDEDCELIFTTEFDYSGEREKIVKQTLRLSRVHDSAAKSVKRRSVNANENGKLQKLTFENTIEHPATNLHVKWWAKVERLETAEYVIPTNVDTGVEFKNKEKQLVKYSTVFDYRPHIHKPSAFVRVNTPHTWVKIEGRSDLEKKEMNIYLYQNDPEPKIVATVTVDPEQKIAQLEARTNEDGDVLLHVSARMVDPFTAALKVWHTESGRREDDADIKVQLDRSDLLKTKFFIRPALNRDLMKKAEEIQTSVQNVHSNSAVRDSLQSLSESQRLLLEDFAREMQPMTQGWAEEQRTIGEEMGIGYQELVDNIEIYSQMAKEIIYACLDLFNQAIEQMASELPMPELREYYRQTKKYVAELPRKIAKSLEPARDYLRKVGEQMDKAQEKAQEAYNNAIEQLDLQTLRDAIRDFCNKLTSDNEIISSLIEYFKQLSEDLSFDSLRDYFENVQKQYEEYKTNAIDSLVQFRDQLMDYAAASGLTHIIEPIVEPITNLDVETKAKDFIKYVRGLLSGDDTIKQYWQQYAPHVTVNQPDEGRFEMEIPLPVKANSLEDLVDQVHPERLNAIKNELQARFSSSQSESDSEDDDETLGYSVWDTIHKFKPASWNIRDQIPPFKSTAYLIGDQHVVTFDGHVFDFNAQCEYLLARDFHDGQFTIIAAFERHQGQTVLSQIRVEFAEHQINLHRNGKIEVDGKAEQLPWQKVDSLESDVIVKVERRDHSTVLTTYDGIEVSCDAYYHVCQVTLPGRYHGKSSGLLGSNDNEPLNDFELADGSDNNDVNAWASHYSVSGDCKANEADATATDSTNNDCRKMFKSGSSPLRPCFGQVAPEPFHQMCLRDMSRHIKRSDNHLEGVCNVTAAYLQACHRVGVTLNPPEQCVRCQSPEGNRRFVSGEEIRVTDQPQMKNSDVVFVVEERLCLKDKKDEIEKVAHQIAAKDSEARFGWVGFGGDGVHYEPHLHTDKDSTHFNAAAVKTMVREMTFEPESGIEKQETDPMRAILYAVEHYAFRSGVQKTIVLVTCQLCNHRAIDHHVLQEALLNQGIVMHVITTEDIEARQTEEPVGFDAQHLFDKSGETTGDRATLERPNDVCAVIAQETFGTVFSVKAVPTAAKKIAEYTEKAQEKNVCQICQCETSEFAPRTVCTPCDIVQPASLNSGSFTGIADFFQKKDVFLL